MGSIYLCGSEEQKQRYLPEMARFDKIGAFGLTEPDVGSGASGGLKTTARRDGDTWILNGQKKWIGNATFGDLTVIWAKDVADGQVKGFIVANDTPGFSTTKLEDKIALRIVQNAVITLEDVRVDESDRLANANSFRDTAEVLRMTRAGVAWMAVGCARGAYENALAYAVSREQFGRPIAGFQLVQDLLVRMLGNITSSWALCARLSQLQDEGCAEDRHSSLAKAWCTVRMRETVGYARELLGGNGILLEHNVGRFVADAEAIYSYEGTREMNTLIVGRAITGLERVRVGRRVTDLRGRGSCGDATDCGDGLAQGRVVALVLSGVRLGEPGERDVGDVTASEIAGDRDTITRTGMRAGQDVRAGTTVVGKQSRIHRLRGVADVFQSRS